MTVHCCLYVWKDKNENNKKYYHRTCTSGDCPKTVEYVDKTWTLDTDTPNVKDCAHCWTSREVRRRSVRAKKPVRAAKSARKRRAA